MEAAPCWRDDSYAQAHRTAIFVTHRCLFHERSGSRDVPEQRPRRGGRASSATGSQPPLAMNAAALPYSGIGIFGKLLRSPPNATQGILLSQ